MLNRYVDFCRHIDGGDTIVVSRLLILQATSNSIYITSPGGANNIWHGVGWCQLN